MHTLLSVTQKLVRLRRRRDEIAAWRNRCTVPIDGWNFDGAPIERGEVWPNRNGVHRFECAAFEVATDWPLEEVRLGVDVGGESLLRIRYASGEETMRGLDVNHNEFRLDQRSGHIIIEAVAKGPFGTNAPDPRLKRAELVWRETGVVYLVRILALIEDAARHLDGHDVQPLLIELGEHAIARLDWPTATEDVLSRRSRFAARWGERESDGLAIAPVPLDETARTSVEAVNAWLMAELRVLKARYPQQGCVALAGHAHLDTAWLWTIDETRRKVQRTFSTVVDLMNRRPEFHFVQSFAEYYRGLEDENRALMEQVKARAAAGQWETIGGFWVEPDINMPCGESLVRQALYGQRYFERVFGRRHAVAWLPDTFGFSPALPQVLRGAGLTGLFTIKIGWSETNKFPHTRFWWEGIDGSRVLVQQMNTPEDTYNGLVDPSSLLRVWRNHADKHVAREALQPIGHGDGGGGPTEEMVEACEYLKDFPAIPSARFGNVEEYFANALQEAKERPPAVWVGELYLEYHRGTLTTQGRTKYLLRRAERDLIAAEVLGALAWISGGPKPGAMEEAWRILMINQFHDILPGSSISDVYRRTERELREIVEDSSAASDRALESMARSLEKDGGPESLFVVNPDLNCRPLRLESRRAIPGGQVAEEGFVLATDETVAPLSARVATTKSCELPAVATPRTLENEWLRAEFGDDGTIHRLYDKRADRDVFDGRGNQIWAWRDQPREYDAWDIDEDYRRAGEEVVSEGTIEIVEAGPQRSAIRISRKYRNSTIVQSVRMWANSPRIDFFTRFDWHDRRLLVQALFPLLVRSDFATFECAFGVQRRPTHGNTSWDAAKFEVAAHRFVDLSEHGYGVALLNDGRYGHHARANELGISLLRSPTLPDRFADEGAHQVTYSLLPHRGNWFEGGVLAEAEDLNRPLFHRIVRTPERGSHTFLAMRGIPCALGALKVAEDGNGLVLRVHEPAGARGPIGIDVPKGWTVSGETTLLEDAVERPSESIGPFEIRSFRLRPN
jgi:alpha-mannosidase